ncbi:MAG TPA: tetratricopeptide repeat protein [Pyrinomonadaceae bacterium]
MCLFSVFGTAQTKSSQSKNQTIEEQIAKASGAVEAGNFAAAKLVLQKLLISAPRETVVHTLAGIVADRENDLAAAEKHFALAARLAPNAPETRNNYGAILVRLNRKTAAAAEFAASLKANPKQSSALVNLAQIRFAEGNLTAARELFEKAKAIAPDIEILRALAAISLANNEKSRAAAEFAEYITAQKTQSPDKIKRDTAFAEALFASGLPNEARQESELLLSAENHNVGALILLSKIYVQQKNIAAAGRLLESAVASGMDDAKIYVALAEVYEAGGYLENAIPAMRLAIKKEPKNDSYRSLYGLLLVNSKAPAAAVIRLEEALKEFPDSPRLWSVLGMAYFDDNKLAEAQKSFEKALSQDSKLVPAMAYLGAIAGEQGRYIEAAKIYQRAIDLNEKIALLHYLLAETLLKMTETDEARVESALKRAIDLEPNLTSAHLSLGRFYVRQSRWAEAVISLERAAKLEPERAEIFYQLGRVYTRLKRPGESQAALAKFKQINDMQKEQKETDRRELVRRLAKVRF